jgi:molybdopterin-guanine dinucleotide biosynthesis protein A
MTPPRREAITGLVLCGGRGRRMGGLGGLGGVEKALLPWAGSSLAANAVARLAPQVGPMALNANREAIRYAALGLPIWPDETEDLPGPLAGWQAALRLMSTEWLLTVPCDAPHFPLDLAQRLIAGVQAAATAPLAIAATADGPQPVFALVHRSLAAAVAAALARGERGVARFALAQGAATVHFDDAEAFADADTPADLARLSRSAR